MRWLCLARRSDSERPLDISPEDPRAVPCDEVTSPDEATPAGPPRRWFETEPIQYGRGGRRLWVHRRWTDVGSTTRNREGTTWGFAAERRRCEQSVGEIGEGVERAQCRLWGRCPGLADGPCGELEFQVTADVIYDSAFGPAEPPGLSSKKIVDVGVTEVPDEGAAGQAGQPIGMGDEIGRAHV